MQHVDDSEDSEDEQEAQYDFFVYEDDTVSRIYSVSTREGKEYYHRTLLLYVRRAVSFEDICKVGGDLCPIFRKAYAKRGL